jgi:hypothetical protein
MKSFLKIPVLFALSWFVLKCIFFFAGMEDSMVPGIMLNILFLLGSIALGLFFKKKAENYVEVNFLDDMKTAIKSGMAYVGLMFVLIYSFYSFVDPNYVEKIKEQQKKEITEILDDPKEFEKVRSENENLKGLSKEDIIDIQTDQAARFVSPIFMSTIALLSMMTGCFINSLIVVLLFKNVLFRKMKVVEK